MNELIKNIEILANQVLITLKKDKITYNEFFISYETYLYIIKLEKYALELNKYENNIKNFLIIVSVECKDIWERINVEQIKTELNPPLEEKIPCLPFKK